jgi:alanine racemase
MDMVAIDLSNVPDARTGDVVELWGENLPVHEIAVAADTIAYELLTQLSRRPLRELV